MKVYQCCTLTKASPTGNIPDDNMYSTMEKAEERAKELIEARLFYWKKARYLGLCDANEMAQLVYANPDEYVMCVFVQEFEILQDGGNYGSGFYSCGYNIFYTFYTSSYFNMA